MTKEAKEDTEEKKNERLTRRLSLQTYIDTINDPHRKQKNMSLLYRRALKAADDELVYLHGVIEAQKNKHEHAGEGKEEKKYEEEEEEKEKKESMFVNWRTNVLPEWSILPTKPFVQPLLDNIFSRVTKTHFVQSQEFGETTSTLEFDLFPHDLSVVFLYLLSLPVFDTCEITYLNYTNPVMYVPLLYLVQAIALAKKELLSSNLFQCIVKSVSSGVETVVQGILYPPSLPE